MQIDVNSVTLPPSKVLIEYFDYNSVIKHGSMELYVKPGVDYALSDKTSTGKGRHLERMGRVAGVCSELRPEYNRNTGQKPQKKFKWMPSKIEIKEGDWVYFPSSAFERAEHIESGDRKFIITSYFKLYMKQNKDENSMLNGYVLAEKVKRENEGKIASPKEQYYDDIYRIVKRGKPVDYDGHYYDDPDVKEGDHVLTWSSKPYPLLEETGHRFYSEKDLYIFQTSQIVATVCF